VWRREFVVVAMLGSDAMAVTLIAVQALGILALEVRLRGQVRHETARARTLIELAVRLPAGSRVDEHRSDGTRLTMIVPARSRKQSGRG
jgi:hypothetical protein